MKSIFDILNDSKVCYSVCVAIQKFKSEGSGLSSKDYYILARYADINSINSIKNKFRKSENFNHETSEYSLNDTEIKQFKLNQHLFIKVQHDKNGRVYELKSNSFKELINS